MKAIRLLLLIALPLVSACNEILGPREKCTVHVVDRPYKVHSTAFRIVGDSVISYDTLVTSHLYKKVCD